MIACNSIAVISMFALKFVVQLNMQKNRGGTMKIIKQLSLLLLSIILILGVCGCMSNNNSNKAEKTKDVALEYLNENYDDTFTALGYSDGDWAYDYSTVNFTSAKYSKPVEVRVYEIDEKYSFKDDYFKLYMENDAVLFFENIVSKYGKENEIKVRFVSPELPDSLSTKATFLDYVSSAKCNMEVYIISSSAFNESDINAILSDICNAKIMGNFRFIVTTDKDLLSAYGISEIVNEKADSIIEKKSYSINSSFKVDNMRD